MPIYLGLPTGIALSPEVARELCCEQGEGEKPKGKRRKANAGTFHNGPGWGKAEHLGLARACNFTFHGQTMLFLPQKWPKWTFFVLYFLAPLAAAG